MVFNNKKKNQNVSLKNIMNGVIVVRKRLGMLKRKNENKNEKIKNGKNGNTKNTLNQRNRQDYNGMLIYHKIFVIFLKYGFQIKIMLLKM